ncbi:MAG: c-type cytochrome, partial [Acidimicrobiales bacterium]
MYTVAVDEPDFDVWVQNQTTERTPLAESDPNYEGEQLFLANCARCHAVFGLTERDGDGDGETEPDSLEMYGNIQEYRDLTDGSLSQGKYLEPGNLTAGAAPNLTHFATRSSYAGSFFELYPNVDEAVLAGEYNDLPGSPHFRSVLEAWLRNPAAAKPNAQPGQARGMPNLNLGELEIDALTDYLLSLD